MRPDGRVGGVRGSNLNIPQLKLRVFLKSPRLASCSSNTLSPHYPDLRMIDSFNPSRYHSHPKANLYLL